ncbi:glycosyltransferase family 2 protein [Thiomicrorhabdus xiamenensis]|uniref:Glycosyltransferase family 2 protein n=1 Tax=Thiomicrorhabdus xiamenensis TaxID=2739063 RepID=A0A7D4SRQ3_9GAMM|nr:glycosyltransferase family 2 protein [Thiomicrorhabdus xiamenensis]QKI88643.1 glycosyltransferase family 2 protein [Thiomicrorhabdus xiamenensis]
MMEHKLSIVIPMYNEEDNVEPMIEAVTSAMSDYPNDWELIVANDGSIDRTANYLAEQAEKVGDRIKVINLQRNYGQTAAMQAGIDAASGEIIATLDGDLQNDPKDIPRMVQRLIDEELDLVAGWRKDRKDALVLRKIPSRIANKLIAKITGVTLNDYGCSLKVYRASIIKNIALYGEMHRFIPAWMATETLPTKIKEEVVTHHARQHGESKYGITRTFRVLIDLLSVFFFMKFRARPAHFFGQIGLGFGAIGSIGLAYLLILKLMGEDIGTRPLLTISVLFMVMSVQFLLTGVLGEMISRTYYSSADRRHYTVRDTKNLDDSDFNKNK